MGHNAVQYLRDLVSSIERVQEGIDELNNEKKEVYSRAKSLGLDVAVLKKVVARRRKDRDDLRHEEDLVELYEAALDRDALA